MMHEEVSPRIALRVITEGSADTARTEWLLMRDALVGLVALNDPTIKPYWKFADSQEIFCVSVPVEATADQVYDEVAMRLGSGWADPTEDRFARWTVWNRGTGTFIAPSARWAHLELIRG